jgi:hypothetical protein
MRLRLAAISYSNWQAAGRILTFAVLPAFRPALPLGRRIKKEGFLIAASETLPVRLFGRCLRTNRRPTAIESVSGQCLTDFKPPALDGTFGPKQRFSIQ